MTHLQPILSQAACPRSEQTATESDQQNERSTRSRCGTRLSRPLGCPPHHRHGTSPSGRCTLLVAQEICRGMCEERWSCLAKEHRTPKKQGPETLNPKPQTLNPKPQTPKPKPLLFSAPQLGCPRSAVQQSIRARVLWGSSLQGPISSSGWAPTSGSSWVLKKFRVYIGFRARTLEPKP